MQAGDQAVSALSGFVSGMAWLPPSLISDEPIVAIVLNLPTTGPVVLQALLAQDMLVAAGFLMLVSLLTISQSRPASL